MLLFACPGSEKFVNIEPVDEGVEPSIAGSVRISEAESVSTILIQVKLDRAPCFEP
jgi:hypothetical protein